jgi:AcrR family transcriptional regulator
MTEEASTGRPRQVTDDQIFDALARTISEDGPNNLSMNKVAARLNMTGPALGYRFGNKHALLQAFAARQPNATSEYLASIAEQFPSEREAITESLVGLIAGTITSWVIDGTDRLENTMRDWIQQVLDRELPRSPGNCLQSQPTDGDVEL